MWDKGHGGRAGRLYKVLNSNRLSPSKDTRPERSCSCIPERGHTWKLGCGLWVIATHSQGPAGALVPPEANTRPHRPPAVAGGCFRGLAGGLMGLVSGGRCR
ncbi:hypothetical protein Y1Q_0006345 [Alligator mississippiensis]|uniref:Uncharacterized protein n=1 Tax=Alligator mississippiensis TaxID=8496 RepID=A0A151NXV5_ALLMI|nr:hypothetical protein Y1Q_0006345 [Alligator mississippiensis]